MGGTGSRDPDNDPIKYSWKQTEGPSVELDDANSAISTFIAPKDISSDTKMIFELTVTDDKNAIAVDDTEVIAKYAPPPNQPPIADAGLDQTVDTGTTVTLDSGGSTDADGSISSYSWTQTEGPAVTLSDASAPSPTFTAPSVSSDTTLKFSLTVEDDKGETSTPTDMSITVRAEPPLATAPTPPDIKTTTPTPSDVDPPTKVSGLKVRTEADPLTLGYTAILEWNENPIVDEVAEYYIYRSTTSGIPVIPGTTPPSVTTDNPFSDSGLEPSIPYWYKVAAVDAAGNIGPLSSEVSAIPAPPSISNQTISRNATSVIDGNATSVIDGNATSVTEVPSTQTEGSGSDEYVFVTKWGSEGTGDGQFGYPADVALDSSGNVYVADNGNNRIQMFDSNGDFITKWGSNGTGDGQFYFLNGIAVDESDNVYVADNGNNRIQMFDSNGSFITKWGSKGTGDGQFDGPENVAIDSSGNVYAADFNNNRIQKFDSNGSFITKWGSYGTGDGQFMNPDGIAIDSSGNVYVADFGNSRIQVFTQSS